ncbi:hypothetical protein PMAYCL1PPCAC_00828, partial [Pristionchus mayeri]
ATQFTSKFLFAFFLFMGALMSMGRRTPALLMRKSMPEEPTELVTCWTALLIESSQSASISTTTRRASVIERRSGEFDGLRVVANTLPTWSFLSSSFTRPSPMPRFPPVTTTFLDITD